MKKVGRVSAETARRITGISTALGGIQWADPGPSEAEHVRRFLLTLEDKRALYNPMWLEVRGQVEGSLQYIRNDCTAALQTIGGNAFAAQPIRTIREACRRFRDDVQESFPNLHGSNFRPPSRDDDSEAGFFLALGALRATIGQQVALLIAHYDLEVEDDLASILPQVPEGD